MASISNKFETAVASFNAQTGLAKYGQACTWHDDPRITLTVPDDGASVVGSLTDFGDETVFWATVSTVVQLDNAIALAKRNGWRLSAKPASDLVRAEMERRKAVQQARIIALCEHAAMKAASRKARREYDSARSVSDGLARAFKTVGL